MIAVDGRLARGEETRRLTLRRAVDIASVGGLDGLSIGRLSGELGLSKSGVFAHFGSKEELQLAAVAHAAEVFTEQVITPALTAPRGLPRLDALMERWLDYSRRRVFPGGCFFAAVTPEFDARPGRVRDALAAARREWVGMLARLVAEAVAQGHLPAGTDPDQLAFELNALGRAANSEAVLTADDLPYAQARTAIRSRLG